MERLKYPKITEKLSKKNYRSWRIEMHAYFRDEGLWGVVSGDEQRGEEEDGADVGEWTKKDAVALSAIRSNCEPTVVRMIHNAYTAKDAWEALLRSSRTESNWENSGPFYQEKLNGTNYTTWENNMKNYLEAEGLWGVVIGEELRVEEHAITSEWTKKNAAALCALRINCNERIYNEMIDYASTATDAWEALFTVFKHNYRQFASTSTAKHEKLDGGDNYRTWRAVMKNYLEAQGLWGVVTGEELPGKHRQMGGKWAISNAKALGAIRFHCSETILPMINDVYIAKDAWKMLLKRFRPPLGILPDPNNQARLNCYPIERAETLLEKYRVIKSGNLYHIARKGIYGNEIIMPENDYTALHVAVSAGQPKVVDYFLEHESMDASMVDSKKKTALALAAYHGKLEIVKKLVRKNPRWLFINDDRGNIPLLAACEEGHEDTIRYLCQETFEYLDQARSVEIYEEDYEYTGLIRQYDNTGYLVIIRCLESNIFGIALEALQSNKKNTLLPSYSAPLQLLAETPITFWKQRVYKGINQIYTHDCALEILKIMCPQISSLSNLERSDANRAMFVALKNGNLEFVTEIIKTNPNMLWMVDESNRDLFMCAIANRHENIARFMHGLDVWRGKEVSVDKDGCNLLHMAGKLGAYPQLSRIFGAALQMQRELQWFNEVERIVPYNFRRRKNEANQTPSEAFTIEHEGLMKHAERWMKDAANSYSIVGALITTIMFAAAFTVPGGNDQTEGFPIFRHKVLFKIFIISVATSFSAAATSVMVFLGILTSRYAPQDYLVSLPGKLVAGLFILFISMAAMMVAFSAAIVLMLKGKLWAIILMVLLGSLPILFFAAQHLPLLKAFFVSTYQWRLFEKKGTPYSRPRVTK